ncbi:MAG: signal transduction histidine kinase, nitrogen specific, NtrB [Acidobacteria bacterium]|jgi:DNA-binding NtrC family response regulator|nr:signal transduction histidine kinase, nitrogen specific, NtrB [Acidobacteriota bacterium]
MIEPVMSGKPQSEGSVLIIDDEPSVARTASRLLHSMGFEVLVATASQEAVEICRARSDEIDVVLLDAVLHETTSKETLRQIRSLRPEIKVILMSGYGKAESVDSFAGMRLDGFVPKPFGYTELESAIRAALARPPRAAK